MKYLPKTPFIRIWANLFVFKGKEGSEDYSIDYITWLFIAIPLLVAAIVIHYQIIGTSYQKFDILSVCIVWLYYKIPLLAMSARRLRDADYPWKLCFIIFLPFGSIWAPVVCIRAKSKEEEGENFQSSKKKILLGPSVALIVICFLTLSVRLLLFGFIFIDLPLSGRDYEKSFELSQYESYRSKVKYAEDGLPSLTEIGNYKEASFCYRNVVHSFIIGFQSYGISLFTDYDNLEYDSAKQFVESRYDFITSPIVQEDDDYTFPVASFSYKGYSFKIAYTSASVYHSVNNSAEHIYPKSFTMVGFDDDNNSLAFLYYYDFDLDFLCSKTDTEEYKNGRMQRLIEEEFYWRQNQK